MNQLLNVAQILNTDTGKQFSIKRLLGSGGQGEVYEIEMDGTPYALKWYYSEQCTTEQKESLERLLRDGSPNKRFLWPLYLISSSDNSALGYIMELRANNFAGIIDMMTGKTSPTFKALCTAGYELADSYQKLHSYGRCYRDISFGNVFFDTNTGEVKICDNDNVTIDGNTACGIAGTQRFMAPEIVRGDSCPSIDTDRFSLAVLLFYMFMMHHPLDGKKELEIHCLDGHAMKKLYGDEPVFIWNPDDTSNRPVEGEQNAPIIYWNIYPQFLKDLFIKTFTKGINNPKNRVVETEWRRIFIQLRDSIMYCSNCGVENFYDPQKENEVHVCWKCRSKIQTPPIIKIGKSTIVLNYNTKLYAHHTVKMTDFDFNEPTAEVLQHPHNPNIWGLRNLTSEKWLVSTADRTNFQVEAGKSVTISLGLTINFGSMEGEIIL